MTHKAPPLDWDDLRYVLEVARHGSLAAAARALGVNHTTVLRRVNAFEESHGMRLFERLPTGYAVTDGGEQLLAAARQMADVVAELGLKLAGQDFRLEGTLRVTTTDTLIDGLLPPILASFRAAHPGIALEVLVGSQFANLSRRDADVAIRPAADPPEPLFGRRIAALGFAVYAAPAYLEGRANDDRPVEWLAPDDTLAGTSIARWMRGALPDAAVALRANSLLTLRQAAAAGLGLAALPCYMTDRYPGLVRTVVAAGVPERNELWLLTHDDLRRTARVRAFMDHATIALTAQRGLIEGHAALCADASRDCAETKSP